MNIVVQVGRLWVARHWRSFVPAAVTIAVCFGLAFFAIAGARRTQSAYPRFLEHVHSSTLSVSTLGNYTDAMDDAIAAIPEVSESRTYIGFNLYSLVDGHPDFSRTFEGTGTFDGRYFDQDRFTPTQGRMADPDRLDEVVINEFGAERLGFHVGEHLDLGVYSIDQVINPAFFVTPPPPPETVSVTLVGIGVFPDEILQDDADRTPRFLITPALSRELRPYSNYGLQGLILKHGNDDVAAALGHLASILPIGDVEIRLTSVDEANALTATNPLSLVLGIFGAIAVVVGTILSGQALARSIRSTRDDMQMVIAIGASNLQVASLSLLASALAAASGVAVAILVAAAASPLMPIGPVRRVEPRPGMDIDFTVLAVGGLAAIAILVVSSAWVAWREVRPARRSASRAIATGNIGRTAGARLTPPAATGVRFALGDRNRVAARSAIVSAVAASVAVVAAVGFAASLSQLIRVPALFGWNFDSAVVSGNGYDNLDDARVQEILGNDPAVATWSGVYFGADAVGDVDVPLIGMQPDSTVRPSLVAGRFLEGDDEIVLGRATANALDAHVGDQIVLEGDGSPHSLRVVGVAVLPTIGKTHAQHTSLGRGAIVVPRLVPGSARDILGDPHPEPIGPNAVFVRYVPGVDADTELAHLRETTAPLTRFAGLDVLPVQRPAEIVSSDDVGSAPVILAVGLALGATIALVIVLITSVRAHRRELAVLTALGFTRKQRAATLMWHSTVVVGLGLVIGVPLGAVAGRQLWQVFAERIDVAAPAVMPWRATAVIVVGAFLLAVALGLGPARAARRLNVAAALRDQ
ncbi:MAG: FtsX-like permease family protein [Ilumatobacteraceae bacterium]